jgi:phage host-nuclease inhibitor protein Gam
MTERKLRSRSFSLVRDVDEAGQETSLIEAEANNVSQETELDRTIVKVNEETNSVTDRQVKGHSDTSNNVVISASQFHEFMNTVIKEFDDLKARMRSENTKLAENIKAVADEMSNKIEIANKNLSDSLTKQFGQENESLKKEFTGKLKSGTLNLTEAMNQLRKDADLEVTSLSHSVETVREKLDDRKNEHMSVAQRQIERVSQEMNTRTRDLAADLTENIAQTNNDVAAIRQEMVELGEQINNKVTDGVTTVSDSVIEWRNKILAEKESNFLKFQKVNQEIEILKAKLASKQVSEILSAAKGSAEQNQVANVNSAS